MRCAVHGEDRRWVRFPCYKGDDGERAARPTSRDLVDLGSFGQERYGFGERQVSGEDCAAVILPIEGAEAGAGEGALGLARQLDDYIWCQPLILKNLSRRPHVVSRGHHQHGAVRQAGGRGEEPAAKALGADDPSAFVVLQCRGKNFRLGCGAAIAASPSGGTA